MFGMVYLENYNLICDCDERHIWCDFELFIWRIIFYFVDVHGLNIDSR